MDQPPALGGVNGTVCILVISLNILYNHLMTSFILKIIAMTTMLIDHFGDAYFKQISLMNLIGRIAFPIFAFQISEGYLHTKNLKKYFLRLFLFALISQIPFMLFYSIYTDGFTLNIFFTLFIGLFAIFLYDKITRFSFNIIRDEKTKSILKHSLGFLIVLLLGIFSQFCHLDYGFFGIAVIFLFYLFRNHKLIMVISFILACILKYGIDYLDTFNLLYIGWYIGLTIFTILPIVFICLYNKKQGPKVKYLLYFFYPVHLLILYFLFR